MNELVAFHRRRFALLAASEADLLACETVPALREVEALAHSFDHEPRAVGWISVSCRDGRHLRTGERIRDAAAIADGVTGVVAVGINCTAPEDVEEGIGQLRSATEKPIVVYPNSGEQWDAMNHRWCNDRHAQLHEYRERWLRAGAAAIGGCCRIGPADIAALRRPPSRA